MRYIRWLQFLLITGLSYLLFTGLLYAEIVINEVCYDPKGARLMVKRLIGVLNPELLTAAKIRSLLSLTALDAIPTIFTPKLSPEASHSTVS